MLVALLFSMVPNIKAQEVSEADKAVSQLVDKYESVPGVECITAAKGNGLDLIKMMFNKQFGKSFMKGVTKIIIIEYSDASDEVCQSVHKDLDHFLSFLEEFNFGDEKKFSENKYMRCFASGVDSSSLSDFVIALENDESKMVMYMAGKIVVE